MPLCNYHINTKMRHIFSAEITFNSSVVKLRRASSVALAKDAVQPKWDLVSSVCLERKPVISADLNEVENQMKNLLNRVCEHAPIFVLNDNIKLYFSLSLKTVLNQITSFAKKKTKLPWKL